jgi:hypothetical protein
MGGEQAGEQLSRRKTAAPACRPQNGAVTEDMKPTSPWPSVKA